MPVSAQTTTRYIDIFTPAVARVLVANAGQRLIFDELHLFCQVGQKSDIEPKILLDWSDDGGVTWSNDRIGSIGAMGEFNKRVIFRRLGQSFHRVFRLRMTDIGRLVITGARVKVR